MLLPWESGTVNIVGLQHKHDWVMGWHVEFCQSLTYWSVQLSLNHVFDTVNSTLFFGTSKPGNQSKKTLIVTLSYIF